MDKLLYYKNELAQLAAQHYLCNPYNSLGENKGRTRKYPCLYFGPQNRETTILIKAIGSPRKKSVLQQIIDAAEKERAKEMSPILLYSLEQPRDDEFIEANPLTMHEFNALINQ